MKTTKMNIMGIGPKLAIISLPYAIISIILAIREPQFLKISFINPLFLKIAGLLIIIVGLVFYIYSAIVFLRDFGKGKLITRGPFALCRNPIYASLIVFLFPGLGLMLQSGIVISIALVLYLNFKISVHGESIALSRTFGEEYEKYKKEVNEIFPFPRIRK